jgi:hypothetical protein
MNGRIAKKIRKQNRRDARDVFRAAANLPRKQRFWIAWGLIFGNLKRKLEQLEKKA